MKGTLGLDYHEKRLTKRSYGYRLRRRAFEVAQAIIHFQPLPKPMVLDVGTADGLTMGHLQSVFEEIKCFGLDFSIELLKASQGVNPVQGNALVLPYANEAFDVVVATAVIEHVPQPKQMLREVYRVLRPGGIIILTTPHPVLEKIAALIGHLDGESHEITMGLSTLRELTSESNFRILRAKRFMVSPIGAPFEIEVERLLGTLKLDYFFMNQLVVGIKDESIRSV